MNQTLAITLGMLLAITAGCRGKDPVETKKVETPLEERYRIALDKFKAAYPNYVQKQAELIDKAMNKEIIDDECQNFKSGLREVYVTAKALPQRPPEYRTWARMYATLEMLGTLCDRWSESSPDEAYGIYRELGDDEQAKRAALLTAQKYLRYYFTGDPVDGERRAPNHLERARYWMKLAEMPPKKIQAEIKKQEALWKQALRK